MGKSQKSRAVTEMGSLEEAKANEEVRNFLAGIYDEEA